MPWVKLDDQCTEHVKMAQIGPLGLSLWVAGLAYCNRNLTDGFIPEAVARTLIDWGYLDGSGNRWDVGVSRSGEMSGVGMDVNSEMVIACLLEAEVWHAVRGGYEVHDFLDYQPSKEQVENERVGSARRTAKWREKKRSDSDGRGDAVCDGVTDGAVTGAPVPVPVPGRSTTREPVAARGAAPGEDASSARLIDLLMTRFNEAFGTRYASKSHRQKIAARIAEYPDVSEAEHLAIVQAAKENQWWKGAPSPAVVWGNPEVFESYREAAAGTIRRLAAVQASEARREARRREEEEYDHRAVPPPPEALAALERLASGKRLDDHLKEGHHEAA